MTKSPRMCVEMDVNQQLKTDLLATKQLSNKSLQKLYD